ncbi:transposase [Candidatus Woesearchaeota archaeon]|nr:transposase [Candidatus Woesearchaeota archaeon]
MARLARVVAPEIPHHVTQRGNRRQKTFFCDEDYRFYIDLLADHCRRFGVEIWAYCLMPNHVHLIAVPDAQDSLAQAVGETHKWYTRKINFREGWRGHLWQGRFASYALDEQHLLACVRYIERNPVAAKIAVEPGDYPWSSARAHLLKRDDKLVKTEPLLSMIENWQEFLEEPISPEQEKIMARHEQTGRPLGEHGFISRIENILGRTLRKGKPGPKQKTAALVN